MQQINMMVQLAKYLALNGVNSYTIDLLGHGASPAPHSWKRAPATAQEALDYLVTRYGLQADRLVLIGHSYGAQIVSRIALKLGPYAALVLIGPGVVEGFSLHRPVTYWSSRGRKTMITRWVMLRR